jgi:hypothetical protein
VRDPCFTAAKNDRLFAGQNSPTQIFNVCSHPCNGRVTEIKYRQSQLKQTGCDAGGGLLMLDLFFRPKTHRIDWWMIALFLISLFSFAGVAAMIWTHSV